MPAAYRPRVGTKTASFVRPPRAHSLPNALYAPCLLPTGIWLQATSVLENRLLNFRSGYFQYSPRLPKETHTEMYVPSMVPVNFF